MDIQILIAFIIYFCTLTGIGLLFYKRNKNLNDFILGNRSVNYWVTAIATQASDMGSWLFLAFPAAIYTRGLIECWTAIGLVVFMLLNWHFIAPKLRTATEQYRSLTLSSYFESRFSDTTGTIRIISAFLSVLFFTFYISSGLVGLGRLFESAFGIDYYMGIGIGVVTATLYTLIGGFMAVAWCDFFQGIFLLFMIILVPLYAFFITGGWSSISTAAQTNAIPLTIFPSDMSTLFNIIILVGGWGLGYFGQPHVLVNFMGIDDVRKIRYAKYIGITWQIIALTAATFIGLTGIAYFGQGIENSELLFIVMTKDFFPSLVAGFVLCGILAAILSTMDSHILLSGSVLAEDVYKKMINKHATSRQLLWISRAGASFVALLALMIALDNSHTIYGLVNYAWSGLGSSFGPLLITSLYSQRINRHGAIAGIITGGIVSGIWPYLNATILPLIPGFSLSLVALYLVSLLTRKQS